MQYAPATQWDQVFRTFRQRGEDLDWGDQWTGAFVPILHTYHVQHLLDLGCGTGNDVLGRFDIHLSVPLVLEYEEVLLRELPHLQVPRTVVDDVLDFHCTVATRHQIFFLWRPYLPDPSDDMLLELAVAARCNFIVTYNVQDFVSVERFALRAIEPGAFLRHIGALP
jgi:predicted nucleic acid-binding protein